MKPLHKFFVAACIGSSFGIAAADPLEQQLSLTAASGTAWNIDWAGVAGRTYFMQWSLDLEAWSYSPMMAFGAGPGSYGTDALGAEKYFVRLRYLDASWITTLSEARAADFDADGIPNFYEIEIERTDPFVAEPFIDSDSDGISDRYELFHFGNTTGGAAGADTDGDGYDNGFEAAMGMDSTIGYTPAVLAELEIHLPN